MVFMNVTEPVIFLHKSHPKNTNFTLKVISFYFKSKLFAYCFRLNNVMLLLFMPEKVFKTKFLKSLLYMYLFI